MLVPQSGEYFGELPDEGPEAHGVLYIDNQMNMVGHQADAGNLDAVSAGQYGDDRETDQIIFDGIKNEIPVRSILIDVVDGICPDNWLVPSPHIFRFFYGLPGPRHATPVKQRS